MTAPLPTPGDLIALLSESVTWHTPTPEGPRATISPQWVERMAEAICARLRPAFEPKQVVCTKCGYVAVEQNVRDTFDALRAELQRAQERLKFYDDWSEDPDPCMDPNHATLRASLARKDEALRACVEALASAEFWLRHVDTCDNSCLKGSESGSAFKSSLADVRAALARPGVKEIWK